MKKNQPESIIIPNAQYPKWMKDMTHKTAKFPEKTE